MNLRPGGVLGLAAQARRHHRRSRSSPRAAIAGLRLLRRQVHWGGNRLRLVYQGLSPSAAAATAARPRAAVAGPVASCAVVVVLVAVHVDPASRGSGCRFRDRRRTRRNGRACLQVEAVISQYAIYSGRHLRTYNMHTRPLRVAPVFGGTLRFLRARSDAMANT
jgi:hypothetical protein